MEEYKDLYEREEPDLIRPRMSREHRAKQFAPFAALKGFEEAIHKKEEIQEPSTEEEIPTTELKRPVKKNKI